MPRGIPKNKPVVTPKKKETHKVVALDVKDDKIVVDNQKIETTNQKPVKEIVREETKEEKKVDVLREQPKAEPVVHQPKKLEPLGPGQKYFEAADGTILIGEADKTQLWHRAGNGGKGCWINPKR